MNYSNKHFRARSHRFICAALIVTGLLLAGPTWADLESAIQAMESPDNPLFLMQTSRGAIYLEMLPNEAPANAERFMALAEGLIEITDEASGFSFAAQYFDGQRFHRVIPGFVIQAGSPAYHPLGAPGEPFDDEINANALGLNQISVLNPDASVNVLLNVANQEQLAVQVLAPLYADMGIESLDQLERRQDQVMTRLRELNLKALYELQGYEYTEAFTTRPIRRGVVALANTGPNTNGAEFFISLDDLPSLNGKYTVIGRIAEGLDVVDAIGNEAIDAQQGSRLSTVIYSLRRINDSGESMQDSGEPPQ